MFLFLALVRCCVFVDGDLEHSWLLEIPVHNILIIYGVILVLFKMVFGYHDD